MKYVLDTDICIELIRGRSPAMVRRLRREEPGDIVISSITAAELFYGADKSGDPEKNRRALEMFFIPLEILAFDASAARAYSTLRALLEREGRVVGPLDLLIAAHAQSLGAILVTNNTREFVRVPKLKVENWMTPSTRV